MFLQCGAIRNHSRLFGTHPSPGPRPGVAFPLAAPHPGGYNWTGAQNHL